ncbi:phage major capsid protein [Roseinatronobacter bogoriensis]|uniref:Phage major capsid protein n=1 Tax=Roseinatronobacter bogoriensis subsp. barguzinensis TaxID=441209 RepID=A0A2K8KE73_9RHOB|nr:MULTISPECIES: phage major capsid protein [Rhodobaca]ATX64450.1 phage major capsid protein [Rhodobaca barguzinensis]MBB4209155.1 HK97 family phage major capsid protein [Rhodobaca bogoriensis DSM 18756]TDW36317.1 HK97 family phage major capsid protein [Rhodobaca barguzinensis]TDY67555.1 HK97 family phage major capsid protein [Rhodobaca bogoriensis DSM 18756]
MLDSVKISRRQSEIRQQLAELAAKPTPTEDETRSMDSLDLEYRTNETRYRAALIAEDTERREAGADLETRSDREYSELMARFELRQVAQALDTGHNLDGATAEIVTELRNAGGYRGIPIPWAALEMRNTVAAGTPDPISTRPIIDRLFPDSIAARMGAQMIQIDHGATEWPVTTAGATVGWQATEAGNVGGPTPFQTADRPLKPDHTLGVQMRLTRKAMKQTGSALEQAVRRDMNAAMQAELDRVTFLGTGSDGQPLGVITGQSAYGIALQEVDELATWAAFRAGVTAFMTANAASGPASINAMIRPELWDFLDGAIWDAGSGLTEWDRLSKHLPNAYTTSNGLAAPAGDPLATTALLTTSTGGIAPVFVGLYGAIDAIRDPYSDAQAGGLRITALATKDVTVARPAQLRVLSGLQIAAGG